ncbi:MAG: helix-turn-helix domain-containing protein [Patescibacteria group bacterium]|jgi:cytoskeletal protein RodZ
MVGFQAKEISNPPNLGESLKLSREKKGVSLAQASQATNISARYLAAIESSEFDKLPGEVYAKNFLKVYAKYLGLNDKDSLVTYQSERKVYSKTRKFPEEDFKKPVRRISRFHLVVTPKIVRGILIGLLALACLAYLGLKVKAIMTPPFLTIISPSNNLITEQSFIELVGQAEPEAVLEINGQQVLADTQGNFSETIDLQSGVNIIEVTAESRHGKQTKKYLQVVVNEAESSSNN